MQPTLSTLIVALLGAGGATFIWTVVKSYLAVRDSAEVREDKAIANLEKWRDDADTRARNCMVERDYWRARAGSLEHIVRSHGIDCPPVERAPDQF